MLTMKDNKLKISLLGSGNVASHLLSAWDGKASVEACSARNIDSIPIDADIFVIAVSDSAIEEVAENLRKKLGGSGDFIVAHTSGTTPIDVLRGKFNDCGVLYPMQTFTKGKALDYQSIPFFIEGSDQETVKMLGGAARLISDKVHEADSLLRRKIHLSSVLACNFVNRLWTLSDSLLKEEGLDISILQPLIRETVDKLSTLSPRDAQTGPARRGDAVTIKAHLDLIAGNPRLQEIYRLLSENIYNEYNT